MPAIPGARHGRACFAACQLRRAKLLSDRTFTEPSSVVAERVRAARERSAARLAGTPWRLNSEIPGSELRRRFAPAPGALAPLERAMDLGGISARGVDRVIRLSWDPG